MQATDFKWKLNTMPKSDDKNLSLMAIDEVKKARTFHKSFPEYKETPLVDLKEIAKYLSSLGYDLILVSRDKDKLVELQKSLKTNTKIVTTKVEDEAESSSIINFCIANTSKVSDLTKKNK